MARNRPANRVEAPRVRAQFNGISIDSITHMEVSLNGSRKSSHFELTVSTGGSVPNGCWLESSPGMAAVKILMHFQQNGSEINLFEGLADSVAYDPINRLARVEGRDYSSVLISSSYQDAYCNQTASEIASQIAQRHGFNSSIAQTTALVGSYQCDGYNQVLLNTHSRIISEWDLLNNLAINEGFELFVSGTTLVFAPSASLQTNYLTIHNADVKSVKFRRVLPLSGQTSLVVKSWNSWLNQMIQYTDGQPDDQTPSESTGLNSDLGTEIAIVRPNLTSSVTEQLAQRYSSAMAERLLSVELVLPGETSLKPLDILTIVGNGPNFNADYVVRSIRRQFSEAGGFTESILAFVTTSPIAM
jgi:hypothetical protein